MFLDSMLKSIIRNPVYFLKKKKEKKAANVFDEKSASNKYYLILKTKMCLKLFTKK